MHRHLIEWGAVVLVVQIGLATMILQDPKNLCLPVLGRIEYCCSTVAIPQIAISPSLKKQTNYRGITLIYYRNQRLTALAIRKIGLKISFLKSSN